MHAESEAGQGDERRPVGDSLEAGRGGWTFGGDTPRVFDQHAQKSIPLYREGQTLIVRLSDFFLSDNSLVLDLGCSTGELLARIAARRKDQSDLRLVGADREPAMLAAARERLAAEPRAEFRELDLAALAAPGGEELLPGPADMILACYTMQFIRPRVRQAVFDWIYRNLNWGGAFILLEKVRAPDARFQDIAVQLYNEFKAENGYSGDEILGKAASLKGVLEPFSSQANRDLLARAGFQDITTILKYVNFEGFLAIK